MRQRPLRAAALLLALAALACNFGQTPDPTETPPTPTPAWATYTNEALGFSISHPPEFQVPDPASTEPFGTLGEQIVFNVSDTSPLDCAGDCPVIEASEPAEIAGYGATKLTGYIGAIGGNIPQQYQTYVFGQAGRFYSFTLYALERSETPAGDDIHLLQAEDVALFEEMLATLRFTE
jgi:hypothetical protein